MKIEAKVITFYTIELTDEDTEKVKDYLKKNMDKSPHFKHETEENIAWAVKMLSRKGEIDLFDEAEHDVTKTESWTEDICWSEFEERTAEEILSE